VCFTVFRDITSSQHFFRDSEKQEICDGVLSEATESFEEEVNLANKEEEEKQSRSRVLSSYMYRRTCKSILIYHFIGSCFLHFPRVLKCPSCFNTV